MVIICILEEKMQQTTKKCLTVYSLKNEEMKRYLFFLALIWWCTNVFANETIIIRNEKFGIDNHLKMVIVNQDINSINTEWVNTKDAIYLDKLYTIETPVDNVQTGIGYQIMDIQGDRYTLYFTQSPLIFITATQEIVNEPKVPAQFTMIVDVNK
jgi:hypothetical protein